MTILTKTEHSLLREKLNAIHIKFNMLSETLGNVQLQLRGQVIFDYKTHVLKQLIQLLSTKNTVTCTSKALQAFLAKNWALVNGTMLAYTALPDDGLTDLLCSIAEMVVKYTPKEKSAETSEENPQKKKKNKDKNKTSLEQANLWKKWRPQYEAKRSNNKPSALKMLMPTLKHTVSESDGDSYPDLDQCDIRWVLENHILIHGGTYLLPASFLLSTCDVNNKPQKKSNPYWDLYGDNLIAAEAMITKQQLARLQVHSSATDRLVTAYQAYQAATSDQGHFLGQLNALVRSLKFNDVQHRGSENKAGQGVYPAIIRFYNYYTRLKADKKNSIPLNLKNAIDKLLTLTTDHNKNAQKFFALAEFSSKELKALKDIIEKQKTILDSSTSSNKILLVKIKSAKTDNEEYKTTYFGQKEVNDLRLLLEQNDQKN
jgi:hypothetical protein